jgi:hypothetical protein
VYSIAHGGAESLSREFVGSEEGMDGCAAEGGCWSSRRPTGKFAKDKGDGWTTANHTDVEPHVRVKHDVKPPGGGLHLEQRHGKAAEVLGSTVDGVARCGGFRLDNSVPNMC